MDTMLAKLGMQDVNYNLAPKEASSWLETQTFQTENESERTKKCKKEIGMGERDKLIQFEGTTSKNNKRLQNLDLKVELLMEPNEMGPDHKVYRQHELTDLKTQVKKQFRIKTQRDMKIDKVLERKNYILNCLTKSQAPNHNDSVF